MLCSNILQVYSIILNRFNEITSLSPCSIAIVYASIDVDSSISGSSCIFNSSSYVVLWVDLPLKLSISEEVLRGV